MRSKTQITIIALFILLASVQFISCKKDNTTVNNSARAQVVDNAIADSTNDSSLTKGLVAWYTFNGDTKDHSGHHNNIIFNNAKPAWGKGGISNAAYEFDGVSSYMQAANSKSLNPSKITICALIKPKGFYNGTCHANYIISKEYSGSDYGRYLIGFDDQYFDHYTGCYTSVDTVHQNFYGSYGDDGAIAGVNDTTEYIKENKWYYVVFSFDGYTSRIYVNGILRNKVKQTTTFNPNTNPLFIGRNGSEQYPYYFKGIIDEIRIYNKVLDKNQVLELYNMSR